MSEFGRNFDGSPQGHPSWKTPSTPAEFQEAFRFFMEFPESDRMIWTLNLLDLSLSVIAQHQSLTFDQVRDRLQRMEQAMQERLEKVVGDSLNKRNQTGGEIALATETIQLIDQDDLDALACYDRVYDLGEAAQELGIERDVLKKRLESIRGFFRERIRYLMRDLIMITSISPQPLDAMWPIMREAKDLMKACQAQEKLKYDIDVVGDTPQPTALELADAKEALFEMDEKTRAVFVLSEVGGLTYVDITKVLGIYPKEVEDRASQAAKFFVERTNRAVIEYMKRKNGSTDVTPMSRTTLAAARQAFRSLPEAFRAVYRDHFVLELPLPEETPFDDSRQEIQEVLDLARRMLGQHAIMTCIAWLRLSLNGAATPDAIFGFLEQPEQAEIEPVDGMGVFEFTLNLIDAKLREALVLVLTQELEAPEIAVLQGVTEEEMAVRIDTARKAVSARIQGLIVRSILKKPGMRRHEARLVRGVLGPLSRKSRMAYTQYMMSDHPLPTIAAELDISVQNLEKRLDEAHALIERQTFVAAYRELKKIEDGRTVSSRILDRMRRKSHFLLRFEAGPPEIPPTDQELAEARKALEELDDAEQEVVTRVLVQNRDEFETAATLGVTVAEVVKRLKSARESFRYRMTSIVTGYLRDAENPGSIRMVESARETGRILYGQLHLDSADLLKRCLLSGHTAKEIAAEFGYHPRRTEDRIESAEKLLGMLLERRIARMLTPSEEVPQAVRWFLEMDSVTRDAYELHCCGQDRFEVAENLRITVSESEQHIEQVDEFFRRKVLELIQEPNGTENLIVRETLELLGPANAKICLRFYRDGETAERIAESLGQPLWEIESNLEGITSVLGCVLGRSLHDWLRQHGKKRNVTPFIEENPEPARKERKIVFDLSKPVSELTHDDVDEEELLDASMAFLLMNVDFREVFLHRRVFGKGVAETAKELNRSEEEVERLYDASRAELKRRLLERFAPLQEFFQGLEVVGGDDELGETLQSVLQIMGHIGRDDAETSGSVEDRAEVESLMLEEYESLLMLWFTTKENGVTNAERALDEIRLERSRQDAPDWVSLPERRERGLTEAERTEARKLFFDLEPETQQAFALYYAMLKKPRAIAQRLAMTKPQLAQRLLDARNILTEQLTRLAVAVLKTSGGPHLTPSEEETGKNACLSLPVRTREVFRRSAVLGESNAEIAKRFGTVEKTIAIGLKNAEEMLWLHVNSMVSQWLSTKVDGRSPGGEILKSLRENPPVQPQKKRADEKVLSISAGERQEIEKRIKAASYENREAFLLYFAAELDESEIAAIQNVTENEAMFRVVMLGDELYEGMLRLIVRWHRLRRGDGDMTPSERITAASVFKHVPKRCHDVFLRHKVDGEPVEKIAEEAGVLPEVIRKILKKAEDAIHQWTHYLAIVTIQRVEDGRPVGERLLGDIKNIRTPAHVWDKLLKRIEEKAETAPEEEPDTTVEFRPQSTNLKADSVVAAVPTSETVDKIVQTKPVEVDASDSRKRWSVVASIAGLLSFFGITNSTSASVDGVFAQGTDSVLTAAKGSISYSTWAALVSCGGLFFFQSFMVQTVLIVCTLLWVRALARTAPTVHAKQSIIRLFVGYYFFAFLAPGYLLPVIMQLVIKDTTLFVKVMLIVSLMPHAMTAFFVYRIIQCFTITNSSQNLVDPDGKFRRSIRLNLTVVAVIMSVAMGIDAYLYVIPALDQQGMKLSENVLFVRLAFYVLASLAAYFCVRSMMNFSRVEGAKTSPAVRSEEDSEKKNRKNIEFLYIFPLALHPLGGNAVHILFERTHWSGSIMEILVYSSLWFVIWRGNVQDSKYRTPKLLLAFTVQIAIFCGLRLWYY